MDNTQGKLYAFIQEALLDLNSKKTSLLNHLSRYTDVMDKETSQDPISARYELLTDGLLDLIENKCLSSQIPRYKEMTGNFEPLFEYVAKHDKLLVKEQGKERFYAQTKDTLSIRAGKFFKRIWLRAGWSLVKFFNIFRKSKQPLKFWKHRINAQHLAHYHYHYKFHAAFIPHFREFLTRRYALLLDLNKFDNAYEKKMLDISDSADISPLKIQGHFDSLNELAVHLEKNMALLEKQLRSEFKKNLKLAGTLELPSSTFRYKKVNRKTSRLLKRKYQKHLRNYHIAEQAVYEYWLFEVGIRASLMDINKFIKENIREIRERVDTHFIPELEQISEGIKSALVLVERNTKNVSARQELAEKISSIKSSIQKLLDKAFQNEILIQYQSFYPSMLDSLKRVPARSRFSSGVFTTQNIRKKYAVKEVRAREILEGMLENTIQDKFFAEGKRLQQKVLQLHTDLEEILQVIDVSYDYYGPKDDMFSEADRTELREGLRRSEIKTTEFKTDLLELLNTTNSRFQELNRKFQTEIMISLEPGELIKTDRKRRLRSTWRFSRRKSVENIHVIYKSILLSWRWLRLSYKTARNKYFNLRSLLGISEHKEILSSEISNYLAETENAISQLPPMYQRLYANSPLTDERFYVKRDHAYREVEKALKNWQDQKFAPACLVGEQGSGATTLLNFFENELEEKYHITRLDLKNRCITEPDFNHLMNQLFPEIKYKSLEEFIGQLNEKKQHTVVILENIQHLFIRKMHGFSNLERLFQLISQSNPGVFWLCSCLQYSWKYLDNSHHISDYFAHIIQLENLSIETLTEAVLKRHRPSGFDMVFLPSEDHKKSRFFLRNAKTDRQRALQDEYFNDLKEATKGNLSSAFLWWLRSVYKVEDNTIYFRFHTLNSGFLYSLETNKITSLYAILIHSGLTCEEHATVFNCPLKESYILLMVMTDDGILSKKGEKYFLNPLLYRHIVSHLEAANFIQ